MSPVRQNPIQRTENENMWIIRSTKLTILIIACCTAVLGSLALAGSSQWQLPSQSSTDSANVGWHRRRNSGMYVQSQTVTSTSLLYCDYASVTLRLVCCLLVTARSVLRKVLFLAPSVCGFFVCVWNISETAEQTCAKFTRKTCLVLRSDKFELWRSRSKVKGQGQITRDKNVIFRPFWRPACGLCLVKHL